MFTSSVHAPLKKRLMPLEVVHVHTPLPLRNGGSADDDNGVDDDDAISLEVFGIKSPLLMRHHIKHPHLPRRVQRTCNTMQRPSTVHPLQHIRVTRHAAHTTAAAIAIAIAGLRVRGAVPMVTWCRSLPCRRARSAEGWRGGACRKGGGGVGRWPYVVEASMEVCGRQW